jgi:beta-barrel assembly-enhancing protease
MSSGTSKVLLVLGTLFSFLAILGWFLYIYFIPASMSFAIGFFPKEWEIEMGKEFKKGFLEIEKVDENKTEAINQFYKNLAIESGYPIHITVVDKSVKNAFALPGGEIVVYSQIIDEMKSYEELVALLAHETAHVYYRHSLQTLANTLANYLIVSAIFGDLTGVSAIIIDNASNLKQLSYSRNFESEADIFAYNIMLEKQINTDGMLNLFNNLRKQSVGEMNSDTDVPEFLLTHPKLDSRIQDIKQRIENEPKINFLTNDSLAYYFMKMK